MRYLVDGYNVLHAVGLLPARAAPTGLERARARLLGLIHHACGDRSGDVTVIFDGGRLPVDFPRQQVHLGIDVRFSAHPETADDLIEELIRRAPSPRQVGVVSDDHRIQTAARRRQCRVLGCLDFLEELDRERRRKSATERPEKQDGMSPADVQGWLDEFADIEESPEFKRLIEPREFRDIDPEE